MRPKGFLSGFVSGFLYKGSFTGSFRGSFEGSFRGSFKGSFRGSSKGLVDPKPPRGRGPKPLGLLGKPRHCSNTAQLGFRV